MSRVHMDPGQFSTIDEEENQKLSSHALAQHEREHPPLAPPRVQRGPRRSTIDFSTSDKSSDTGMKKAPKISKRAFDVTRRLSVSSAMFSQLQSLIAMQDGGPGAGGDVKYENTYRIEPNEEETFIAKEVSDIMTRALMQKLGDVTYDAEKCAKLSCTLTNIIKCRIQENLDLPRYKLIINVIIGERKDQALQMASRCLWNESTDRSATATYQNKTLFAVATTHGVYFD